MTEDYKDFLHWATPQLTLNQYRKLVKIIYPFKKYSVITDQASSILCRFKDDQVYAYTHFPKFFDEMGKLVSKYPNGLNQRLKTTIWHLEIMPSSIILKLL